ncbi:uncharacterized protein L199_008355 [Kwoniella botswanensis]|uniref:uncharacterized protein n=1 Tax=Kwoniella botswanensis TaxID=1268659 RepID=UPI00315C85DB
MGELFAETYMSDSSENEDQDQDQPPELLFRNPWKRKETNKTEQNATVVDRALTLESLRHYVSQDGALLHSIGNLRWTCLFDSDCGMDGEHITRERLGDKSEPYQFSEKLMKQMSSMIFTDKSDTDASSPGVVVIPEQDLDFLRTNLRYVCLSTLRNLHRPGDEHATGDECPSKTFPAGHTVSLINEQDAYLINDALSLYDHDPNMCSSRDRNIINRFQWSSLVPIRYRTMAIEFTNFTTPGDNDERLNTYCDEFDLRSLGDVPVAYTITTKFVDLSQAELDFFIEARKRGEFTGDHPGYFTPRSLPPPPTTPSTIYTDGCSTPVSPCSSPGCDYMIFDPEPPDLV